MANVSAILSVTGFSLALLAIYRYVIYPAFFSPLSKIPNAHPTSAISPAWILWIRFRSRENRAVNAAHEQHGSIVRLGPNEVSVNCVDGGLRTVYGGGFDKHDWYSNIFHNYGVPNMFSTTLSRPHSARKRMISNIYSKSYINASPQLHAISQTLIFDRLLRLIQHAGDGTSLDVLELNFAVTMDFINAYLFGLSNGTNFLQEEKTKRDWLSLYQSRKQYTFWSQELPNLTAWLARIGIRLVPKWVDAANREIEAWCMQMCDAAETTIATSSAEKQNPESEPIVYRQLKNALSSDISKSAPTPTSPPTPNQRLLLASEMLDHLAAGHETSGITLTYLMHELSQRPHLQSRLRAELLTLSLPLRYPSKTRTLPSPKDLDALPLLHAVLMETLRLRSAIPGGQPRITPSSTTTLGKFTDIPPGVRVNAQAYSLHRNAEVFPDPEVWRPERWLDGSREGGDAKSRWFWAFGSGGRMCVGSNFAMHEMKLIVTAIYTNFRTSIVDETGIEQVDSYVAGPTRNMLMLRFEHV